MKLQHGDIPISALQIQPSYTCSTNSPGSPLHLTPGNSYTNGTSTTTPNDRNNGTEIEIGKTDYQNDNSQQSGYVKDIATKKVESTETKIETTRIKMIMVLLTFSLNVAVFLDAYNNVKNIEYIEDILKATLAVMGTHLVIEHLLEHIICTIAAQDMILYSTTACIRDIINNIAMTLFYVYDDYAYWWRPMMWGCYMADLVMLHSKWNYFKISWLKFVFAHHFGVGAMLLILNHTTKILTDPALVCLILFMNSNTPGCASPIWKAFKLPLYQWSSILCFVLQRAVRIAAYIAAFYINPKYFMKEDYFYIILVIFAVVLDIWDIYSQMCSICKFRMKKKELQAPKACNQ